MSKFTVVITEILERKVEVEASTASEAEEIVRRKYYAQEIVLDSSDFVNAEFTLTEVDND